MNKEYENLCRELFSFENELIADKEISQFHPDIPIIKNKIKSIKEKIRRQKLNVEKNYDKANCAK